MSEREPSPTTPAIRPGRLTRSHLDQLVQLACRFLDGESSLPARGVSAAELRERLGIELSEEGRPLAEVLDRLDRVLAATPSAASPRFLNQLFGGRDPIATLAEMLVPLSNTSMYTYKVAGAQVLVEQEVLSRLLAAVGYREGEGAFCPGGSLANLTALLIARNERLPDARQTGLDGRRLTVYTSADAHYSIPKAAAILGLGRDNVRAVATDERGAVRVEELEKSIERDRASGSVPLAINATAGTTVLGAIDPLAEIADVAARQRLWLHVDGALAGSVRLSQKYGHLLAGCERADSFTWNAHKMMGVPLPCSVLLVRRAGLLARHLGEAAGYLFQADDAELNPGTRSLQCGRRNDALKLWAAWQMLGDRGYDDRLTRLLDLARFAAELIRRNPGLELVHEPQTVNVCFRVRGCSAAELCDHLDRHAILKIGHGSIGGRSALRLVCVDPDLDEERIRDILELVLEAGRSLRGPKPSAS
jgi:glutamate/tyrosine decarboxylase-like PLP-dependent enzyme